MKTYFFVFLSILLLLGTNGCSKKQAPEGDEPTKYQSQAGLEQLTRQAQESAQKTSVDTKKIVTENPKFHIARDIRLDSTGLQALDAQIRPVLVQQFGAAKVVEQNNEPVSESPEDLTLNSMVYVVREVLNKTNVRELHGAIEKAGFTPSIRLGRKPTIVTNWGAMSFVKRIEKTQYSISLYIDFVKQIITVKSYKPGSPYDTGRPLSGSK